MAIHIHLRIRTKYFKISEEADNFLGAFCFNPICTFITSQFLLNNEMRMVQGLLRGSFCIHSQKNSLMGKAKHYNGFKMLKTGKQQMWV